MHIHTHIFHILHISKKKTHQNLKLLHVQLDYVERSHSKLILCLSILPLTMCHTKLIFAGFLCAITVMNFIDIKTTPLSSENKLSVSQASSFPAALKWGWGVEFRLLNSLWWPKMFWSSPHLHIRLSFAFCSRDRWWLLLSEDMKQFDMV